MFLFPFEQRIDQTVEKFLRAAVAQVQHPLAADAVVAVFAPAEPTAEVFARMSGEYERFIEAPGP